jgi:hypothetical protein
MIQDKYGRIEIAVRTALKQLPLQVDQEVTMRNQSSLTVSGLTDVQISVLAGLGYVLLVCGAWVWNSERARSLGMARLGK